MSALFGILCFFGLGFLALIILVVSAFRSRTAIAVALWAVIAIILMVLQCELLSGLAGIGSATSGSQAGYRFVTIALWVFGISLALYFAVAIRRVWRFRDTK